MNRQSVGILYTFILYIENKALKQQPATMKIDERKNRDWMDKCVHLRWEKSKKRKATSREIFGMCFVRLLFLTLRVCIILMVGKVFIVFIGLVSDILLNQLFVYFSFIRSVDFYLMEGAITIPIPMYFFFFCSYLWNYIICFLIIL